MMYHSNKRNKRLHIKLVDRIESSDEWIQQRTGIESRRFAGPDETVITMAKAACESALKRAQLTTTSTMLSESTSRSSVKFLSSSIDAAGIPATSSTISLSPASTSAGASAR